MSFLELAQERYSVRSYLERPVEKEKIMAILEAARLAPSAVNYQPVHFIVITDPTIKDRVVDAYPRDWFRNAPVLIVACGDHSQSWKRKDGKDHCDIDVAIAVDHLILAAADVGLGTCWVCAFDAEKVHEVLELPDNLEVTALIPVGYPDDNRRPLKKRKEFEQIVSWDKYGKTNIDD